MRLLAMLVLAVGGCTSGWLHPSPDADSVPSDAGVDALVLDARPLPTDSRLSDASVTDAGASPIDAEVAIDAEPAADAPPCTPSVWVQLLANPDFDLGHSSWTETGSATIITDSAALVPHSGSWVAWLLGYNSVDEVLSQTVTVPADATVLRLRGFQCLVTSETGASATDNLSVELRDGPATDILVTLSNLDAGSVCDWVEFSHAAAGAHAGNTIELAFAGRADALYPSSFYFDSLILEAYTCP